IRSIAHIEVLREFQRIFSRLTGLSITLVNLNADFITEDRGCRPFCLMMAEIENSTGISPCWQSNRAACRKVFRKKKPLIYQCHAGLTEILVPIIVNDNAIGALLSGQIRVSGKNAFSLGLTGGSAPSQVKRLKDAYGRVPVVPRETVE
ncbi:MAG: PocR ligand-binding domain-containing protein, partial [Endomicrobiales bacterium]